MPWQKPPEKWFESRGDELQREDLSANPEAITKILEPAEAASIGLVAVRFANMPASEVRRIYTGISWGYVIRMRHLIYQILSPHTELQPEDCIPITGGLYPVEPGHPITIDVAQTQLGLGTGPDFATEPQK